MELKDLESSLEKIVKIQKVEGDPKSTDSYMGGYPFVPSNNEDWEWPKAPDGDPLIFVIQINFKDVPKGYGYPESGLMQVFIDLGAYEYNYAGGLKIFYYKESELNLGSESSPSDSAPLIDDDDNIYFDNSAKRIELNEGLQIPPETYWDAVVPETYCKTAPLNLFDDLSEDSKRLHEIFTKYGNNIADDFAWYTHHLGGTPDWIQDTAFDVEEPIPTFILQIASDDDIMFGDAGNMQVFGSLEKLHEGDFTDFKWDWACS
jgi:uncharacterized protein YwqG